MVPQRARSSEEFDRDSTAEVEDGFIKAGKFASEEFWRDITRPLDGTEVLSDSDADYPVTR